MGHACAPPTPRLDQPGPPACPLQDDAVSRKTNGKRKGGRRQEQAGGESKLHTACVVLVHSAAPIFVVASEGVETSVVRGNVVEHAGAGWAVQRLLSVGCPEIDLGPTDRLLLEGTGHNLRPSQHTVRGKPVRKGRRDRQTDWQTDTPTRRHADTNTRRHATRQAQSDAVPRRRARLGRHR